MSSPAFQVTHGGKTYYDIYPTYESSSPIEPKGHDAFGFAVGQGMSMEPDSFSGIIYYKEAVSGSSWVGDEALSSSDETISGYIVKGKQLGTPDYPLYLKGCCYCRAAVDSSDATKKIELRYVYDRSGTVSYTIGLTIGHVSVAINSSAVSKVQERSAIFSL